MKNFVGLDVHKKYCQATVKDEDGKVLLRDRFPNEEDEYSAFLDELDGEVRIAMEATYAWQFVYEQLEEKVEEVKLAHPKETEVVSKAKIKTDVRDSEALADLLRANLVPEAWVPPKEVRKQQEKLRRRAYLVWKRTGFMNKIRAELSKRGIRIDHPFSKAGKTKLRNLEIEAIDDYLEVIEALDEPIKRISNELKREVKKDERAKILTTIPGVGPVSAMTVLAETGDIDRFPDPENLCSYAGLVPQVDQSGGRTKYGPITKEGNKYLRWIMVECAWMHLRHGGDTHLTRFMRRIAKRKNWNIAAVATARKMLTAMYFMLKREEEFRPQG